MVAEAQACVDSFTFFTSTPLVVQQPLVHPLLVVVPVRRECCSWTCDSSSRVTYFTGPTSTSVQPARAGVDFIKSRGAVLFEVGQQRAQLAVEVLPALAGDGKGSKESTVPHQRAFAIVLEAPANASTTTRASTEIIVESKTASKSPDTPPAETVSASYTVVGVLVVAGLVLLVACWFCVRRCRLPRRERAFQYKVLLLPRRNSGSNEVMREALAEKKSGVRRMVRRVSSFKNWIAIVERRKSDTSDHVVPDLEDNTTEDMENGELEEAGDDSESEEDLRKHLASIQSTSSRQ